MKNRMLLRFSAAALVLAILMTPSIGNTQEAGAQEDNGVFVLGSILLSIVHLPFKLATCVGTQATAAVAYTATFGVPGNYDGGTNGKEIGEVARRSCTGAWFIKPNQIKDDYGS